MQVSAKTLTILFLISLIVAGLPGRIKAQPAQTVTVMPDEDQDDEDDEEVDSEPAPVGPASPQSGQQPAPQVATQPTQQPKQQQTSQPVTQGVRQPAAEQAAQPEQFAPAARPLPGVAAPPAQPASPKQARSGDVSFNFDDADVFSVIQTIFGDVMKVNYIVDPQIKGRVNFRSVSPIPRDNVLPLMGVILRLNGIGVVEENSLYRIIPISDIPKEPAQVDIGRDPNKIMVTGKAVMQVIPVRYVQSSEMVRVLTPFLSAHASIIDVPKSNYIIVSDTSANIKRLLQLVEIFDSELIRQVRPQVFVYPVQNSKAKDISSLLNQIFLGSKTSAVPASAARAVTPSGQPPAAAQQQVIPGQSGADILVSDITKIFSDDITNSVIILTTPEDYLLIADTIKRIDIAPRQVMIEALIVDISLTDDMSFGIAWSAGKINFDSQGVRSRLTGDIGMNADLLPATAALGSGLSILATDATDIVRAKIEALASQNKAKVVSAPHILVSDNREARIQIGDQIPVATSTTTTPIAGGAAATNTTTSTIQYKDTGTILRVKPQVNDSGLVSLEITQEVSIADTKKVLGTDHFVIRKREVTTNLVVQDGQTIVIGGLMSETTSKGRSGIPFLSKIPLLGYLFGSTTDNKQKTELVILLTPRVMRNQHEAREITREYMDKLKDVNKDLKKEGLIRE